MKDLVLLSVCIATIAFTGRDNFQLEMPTSRNTPLNAIDWRGKYEYVFAWDIGVMYYSLTIADANACLIEAEGQTTSYKILCVGRDKGSRYEIYFFKSIGDEPVGLNINAQNDETPLLTLYYKNNILYTDDVDFLVKDLQNPTKRLFTKIEDEFAPADTTIRN